MFVTESGNAMEVILEQTEKALYSIVVTESGIVTDGRLLHPEKHWLPINVSVFGKVMAVSRVSMSKNA